MKWEIKSSPDSKVGDRRKIRKFAWFPTRVGIFRVWLEYYQVTQEFQEVQVNACELEGFDHRWVETERTMIF